MYGGLQLGLIARRVVYEYNDCSTWKMQRCMAGENEINVVIISIPIDLFPGLALK